MQTQPSHSKYNGILKKDNDFLIIHQTNKQISIYVQSQKNELLKLDKTQLFLIDKFILKEIDMEAIKKVIKKHFTFKIWNMVKINLNAQKVSIIFKYMKQASNQEITLIRIKNPKIIIEIQNIHFTKLKKLELRQNKILNIQALNNINDVCLLQTLDISFNLITSFKPLSKCLYKKLNRIMVQNNRIKLFDLSRVGIVKGQLKLLSLQDSQSNYVQNQDISFLTRFQPIQLQILKIESEFRINQLVKMFKIIQSKYLDIIMIDYLHMGS